MKESIAVTGHSMTKARTFPEESSLPDHLPGPESCGEIFPVLRSPDLVGGQQEVNHARGAVTEVNQSVSVVTFAGGEVPGVHLEVEDVVNAGPDELLHLGRCEVVPGLQQQSQDPRQAVGGSDVDFVVPREHQSGAGLGVSAEYLTGPEDGLQDSPDEDAGQTGLPQLLSEEEETVEISHPAVQQLVRQAGAEVGHTRGEAGDGGDVRSSALPGLQHRPQSLRPGAAAQKGDSAV